MSDEFALVKEASMQRVLLIALAFLTMLTAQANAQQKSTSTYTGAVPVQSNEHVKAKSNVGFDTKAKTPVNGMARPTGTLQQRVTKSINTANAQTARQQAAISKRYPAKTSVPPITHSH